MTDLISKYNKKISKVLITEEEIRDAIKIAGKKVSEIYDGRPILLVSILKGAFVFLADICRAVSVPCEVGFMCAKSYYQGTVSTGVVKITMDLDQDISNYHVVIIEDIIDTGLTMHGFMKQLKDMGANSVELTSFVFKPEALKYTDATPKYAGLEIPTKFVLGYGLDFDEKGRNLPALYVLHSN